MRPFLLMAQAFWWLELFSVYFSWSPFGSVKYLNAVLYEVRRQCTDNAGDPTKLIFGKYHADECGKLEVGVGMYMMLGELGWRLANLCEFFRCGVKPPEVLADDDYG